MGIIYGYILEALYHNFNAMYNGNALTYSTVLYKLGNVHTALLFWCIQIFKITHIFLKESNKKKEQNSWGVTCIRHTDG
jgi:hypothetical protein